MINSSIFLKAHTKSKSNFSKVLKVISEVTITVYWCIWFLLNCLEHSRGKSCTSPHQECPLRIWACGKGGCIVWWVCWIHYCLRLICFSMPSSFAVVEWLWIVLKLWIVVSHICSNQYICWLSSIALFSNGISFVFGEVSEWETSECAQCNASLLFCFWLLLFLYISYFLFPEELTMFILVFSS